MSAENDNDHTAISTEVRAWYDRYIATFASLARGESSDLEAVANYYAIPCTLILDDRYVALADQAARGRFVSDSVDRLRRADYDHSTVHRLDVRTLNARAALIQGVYSRHDRRGNEFARFGGTYLVGRTDDGWRITAFAFTQA